MQVRYLGYAIMALVATGCAGAHRYDSAWPPARPLGRHIPAYKPSTTASVESDATAVTSDPVGTIDLGQALAMAMMHSPDLAADAWEVRAAEARAVQASLPMNPAVSLAIEELRWSDGASSAATRTTVGSDGSFTVERESEAGLGDGFGNAAYSIGIGQVIELGGKRRKRHEAAQRDRDLIGWDYETRRLDVLTDTAKAFIDVAGSQQKVALLEQLTAVAVELHRTVARRVEAGKVSPLEESQAGVAASVSRIAQHQATHAMTAARNRLASMWGSTRAEFDEVASPLDAIQPIPEFASLERLVADNPDVARWVTELEARQAALTLARAKGVGDLELEVGYTKFAESGDETMVLGVGMALPIFDSNQGGIAEAKHQLAKAVMQQRSAEVRAATQLAEAYEMLASAYESCQSLQQDVLPSARAALEAASESYKQGKAGYLAVLDVQQTLFEAELQRIDLLVAYHHGVVDVERLIGRSLSDVSSDQTGIEEGTNNAE